jgi:glycosyltransferase involved in cell wall biosynthesis
MARKLELESSARPADAARLLLYAPNVHTGGGAVLLESVLAAWPARLPLLGWLDERARARLPLPADACIRWVRPEVGSRLRAEFALAAESRPQDQVLCFHGLPPLLRNRGRLALFQQNRLYFGQARLADFGWRTRLRLRIEQAISRALRRRVQTWWVQTPSMAQGLRDWYGAAEVDVRVLPFAQPTPAAPRRVGPRWDFVYVADGEAHKNHASLLKAWQLLAEQGLHPSLALTLGPRDERLARAVAAAAQAHGLRISNLGQLPHAQVLALYADARALIFPSRSESFGLPLVEARRVGLPILAGELDFVRDVCEPVQTFDPASPVSIARAVRRFLGSAQAPLEPGSAADFLRALLQGPA